MSQKSDFRRLIELTVSRFNRASQAFKGSERLQNDRRNLCTVIYYHSVMRRDLSAFKDQVNLIESIATARSTSEMRLSHSGEKHAVMVTCDDALESFFDNAFPLLAERGIPVCTFLPVGWRGQECGWQVKRDESSKGDRVLTQDRLRDLAQHELLTIGAHGVSHRDFKTLSEAEMKSELVESRSVIEDLTGKPVTSFSFPYGSYGKRELECALEHGYVDIFTTLPGCLRSNRTSPIIPRFRVDPYDSIEEFELKLSGHYRWLGTFSKAKRALLS